MYEILNEGTFTEDVTQFDFNANFTSYLLALRERYTPEERMRIIEKAIDTADTMFKVACEHDQPDDRILNVDLALTCFFALHSLASSSVQQIGADEFSKSQRVAALIRRARAREIRNGRT